MKSWVSRKARARGTNSNSSLSAKTRGILEIMCDHQELLEELFKHQSSAELLRRV